MTIRLRSWAAALAAVGALMNPFETMAADSPSDYPYSAPIEPTIKDLAYGDKSPLEKLDLYLPAPSTTLAPLVVWIHGGAFIVGDKRSMPRRNFGPAPKPTSIMGPYQVQVPDVAALVAKGYAVASLNYRLGSSFRAGATAGVQDGKAALRFLRANAAKYRLDPEKFAVWGNSAGGYMAAMLAVTGDQASVFDDPSLGDVKISSAVQAAIVWFGAEDGLSDPELQIANYISHAKILPPFRIVNGDADQVISPAQAQRLHDALLKAGAKSSLTILPGAGHEDPAYMKTQLAPAFAFLDEVFGRRKEPLSAAPMDYSPLLGKIAAQRGVPGMALVVLRDGHLVAEGAAGVRKLGAPEKITLDDQFHLGSDTKAMTATLIGLLVDEGKLKWSTTLGEIFGDSIKGMRPEWKSVTLQQVLEHRGGFPANTDPKKRRRDYPAAPVAELRWSFVTETFSAPPEYPPGTKFEYSNTGYIVLGAVIDRTSGRTWEEMIAQRLFTPLEITSGGFGAPGRAEKIDQPWGHLASGPPIEPGPLADNPAFYGPAGTVHLAMRDWAKFVDLHLRGDPANPHRTTRLLSESTFAHLHSASPGYIGGWAVMMRPWAKGARPTDTGKVLTHAGSNNLWYCVALLAPEIDFAVLVCANKGGDNAAKACDEVASALIAELKK